MEQLVNIQSSLGKEIEKLASLFYNEAPEKKTFTYLSEKVNTIDQLWEEFELNDDKIRNLGDEVKSHAYFTRDYYNAIKKLYDELKGEMLKLINYTSKGATKKAESKPQGSMAISGTKQNACKEDNEHVIRAIRRQNSCITTLEYIIQKVEFGVEQTKQYYETKVEAIKHYWQQIEEINNAVWESATDISSIGYDMNKYLEFQDKVQTVIIQINQKISALNSDRHTNSVYQQTSNQSHNQMKLPKVVLPKFDGDYLKWRQFYDLFSQMVHSQAMPQSQKMWYLKMNLSGEAEKLIRHLSVSEENYSTAWSILKNRYENKRLLVTALLDKLMAQQAIATESAESLKRLHDTTKECILSLQNLGLDVLEHWDPIVVHIVINKLDKNTHALYEQSLTAPRDLQSIDKLLNFIEMRFQALEALGQKSNNAKPTHKSNKSSVLMTSKNNKSECIVCNKNHAIYFCETFLKMNAKDRQEKARELNLCLNCLKKGHTYNKCTSRNCQKCNKKHNTLLHFNQENKSKSDNNTEKSASVQKTSATNLAAQNNDDRGGYVFLGTAVADVINNEGKQVSCRIVLDSGSQLNFVTEKLRRKLRLKDEEVNLDIAGIGKSKVTVKNKIVITIKSKHTDYTTQIDAYVIKEISAYQPQQYISTKDWELPENINFADSDFNKPQPIDILLGAEAYGEVMRNGQMRLGESLPMLQNTTLGWIVLGKVRSVEYNTPFCGITNIQLENQIQKFWEMEDCPSSSKRIISTTDRKCEEYFEATTYRDAEGRFVVNLPMLSDAKLLGESKEIAFKRLLSIERRLAKEPYLHNEYHKFLEEYVKLGHMQEIKPNQLTRPYCFFPHHCVVKPTSTTTKVRVVFDASARTSNGLSLNDLLLNGPKIQDDLISIILRFRFKKYVFTADIEKMYRQIKVADEDRNLQLIMWRSKPTDPVKYYQLCTVTYGTKSAPYLAIKCLQKLAEEECTNYPLGAGVINDFYVDDVLTGSDDLDEAVAMQQQLISLLQSGGFKLRKWCSNHPRLIQNVHREDLEIQLNFSDIEDEGIKTLGLTWHPITDLFVITSSLQNHTAFTKRTILADMSKIFDPLGLINPVVVMGKIFIQKLWKLKLDWDTEIPVELHSMWLQYRNELSKLKEIKIHRHIFNGEETVRTELHAFADASEKAYGCAVYVKSKDKRGNVTVRLLCAKSRVAPVKPVNIPRLELCAARLAAQVIDHVKKVVKINFSEIYYWTDSQIVISWLKKDPAVFKTFVANRVVEIQELTQSKDWRYVNTKDNPADLVSRGLFPEQLKQSKLWFEGPAFLKTSCTQWPQVIPQDIKVQEEEKTNTVLSVMECIGQHPLYDINHNNSFRKLQRIMAYVIRGIKVLYLHFTNQTTNKHPVPAHLTVKELDYALEVIIREIQSREFKEDISNLQKNREVSKTSKLTTLAPFIDQKGILRVGGRLEAADVAYDTKHPILLPSNHFTTKLIMNDLHIHNFHAGPQALHSIARQKFWILQGRNIARSIVANCVRCARFRPRLFQQQMGNLPSSRVNKARPFINCGVDFCGPIYTHFKIRGKRPQKSYLAVFCCFTTKAVHIEVVSDLTTEGFLAALRRFIARRGKCENIYCDNAKNFIGANNQLSEIYEVMNSKKSREKIVNMCLDQRIQFNFIPPRSPHFGGLWEAAVKSIKNLLYRTIAPLSLTYEELCTATAEIEAILNSRPITPVSSDPNDLTALTPAHFLIGEPMTSNIETTNHQSKLSLQARWELINSLRTEFWQRWYQEYLVELQKRAKWTDSHPNIQPGSLVIIKDNNLPPLRWSLGRVEEAIQGPDGKVRVVDVKTATGVLRRAIHQLAPIPVDQIEKESIVTCTSNNMNEVANNDVTPSTSRMEIDNQRETNKKENEECSRKRKGPTNSSNPMKVFLLTMFILPLMTHSAPVMDNVEIQHFDNNIGIYFEDLGQASIMNNWWNLIVYYDLKGYWSTINTIERALTHLKRLSNLINHNDYYIEIIRQYQYQLQEIKNNNVLLESNDDTSINSRRIRAPFNIIGTISNKLFGVLDEEYAEQMTVTINNVKTNEDHLLQLIKNQTSILETTMNIVRRGEEERINQTKEIEKALEMAYEKMRNLNNEMKQQKSIQHFNTLSVLISSLVSECRFMQDMVLDVLTDTHHGRANPLIISPVQLRQQLAIIKNNLKSGTRLPFINDQLNIPLIYRLMTTQCKVKGNYVLFKITVPLLSSTNFQITRLIPLPVLINNTFASISTSMEYLMTNIYRDQFYLMTSSEFTQCLKIGEDHYFCEQHRPIQLSTSANNNCEINIFNQRTMPKTCSLLITPPKRVWIQLHISNHWLFSLDKSSQITFICNNRVIHKTLKGTGLMKLRKHCVMKDDEITISAINSIQTKTSNNVFQPVINLTYYNNDQIENNTLNFTLPQLLNHKAEFEKIATEITHIRSHQTELKDLQPHDIHQFTVSYTTLGIIATVIMYLIIRYLRKRSKMVTVMQPRTHPRPRPRKKELDEESKFEVKNFKVGQDVESHI